MYAERCLYIQQGAPQISMYLFRESRLVFIMRFERRLCDTQYMTHNLETGDITNMKCYRFRKYSNVRHAQFV